ncbi:hypothetical protein [Pseudomonas sp. AFG_SD02_1510_Pfu_092]|uniref:hypothetical protein n=1 Tax=Pseudomonas sp. AFG_SD02_1510_Pfu_092 TaxID=2259497 RepID=UPI001058C1FB|nr:hypothetical protein [Pseudomonas sp. AFG_SD02_1510_Pfu_092]
MKATNDANYIKWLLNDLILDLSSAVSMGREIIKSYSVDPQNLIKTAGRLRVCNHSTVLSLFKLHEIRIKYGSFLNKLSSEQTKGFFKIAAEIEHRNICKFRNKYAAHIFDKDTHQPISLEKGEELLKTITGPDNSLALAFYDWICPEAWSIETPCVITEIDKLRSHCRGLPGGDLGRP